MDQSENIRLLADAGFQTPKSWRTTAAAASSIVGTSGNSYYYCRTQLEESKVTTTLLGDDLNRLSALAPSSAEWLIQPLLDFEVGGAAFRDIGALYVEAVVGTTIGLLRYGELGLARLVLNGSIRSFTGRQATAWVYEHGQLVEAVVEAPQTAALTAVNEEVAAALSTTSLAGLFEWGWSGGKLTLLDLKPLPRTGALSAYVRQHLEPDPRARRTSRDVRLPLLGSDLPASSPLVFERGARLSHVVSYRCADGRTDVTFRRW